MRQTAPATSVLSESLIFECKTNSVFFYYPGLVVEKKTGFREVDNIQKNGFRVRENPVWKHYVKILVGESIFLCLVWERRSHTSFFSSTFLPASNNFWTKVQLSTKSDAFYQPIFCCF